MAKSQRVIAERSAPNYLIQNLPNLTVDAAAAVSGNTSFAKLQSAQPKFVRRTHEALEL